MVEVDWVEGAIVQADAGCRMPNVEGGLAGAVLVFEGRVREQEHGRRLLALDYATYEPMSTRELRALAAAVVAEFGVMGLWCTHSVGRVSVGAVSFRLVVASAHRREGIDAVDAFIARMKAEVPIWKTPVWA